MAYDLKQLRKNLVSRETAKSIKDTFANKDFTMRPNYPGSIPPELSMTKYIPNVKGIKAITPNINMMSGFGKFAGGAGAAYGIYDMFKDVSVDPSGIIMTPERRRMIDNMNKPSTNILSDDTRNNIGGAIAQVFSPSAVDTEFQTQDSYPIKHPTGFESTVAGSLAKDLLSPQEQFNMPMLTAPAQAITGTNPMEFGKPNQAVQAFMNNPNVQNTEVQSPIIKADTSNPDDAHNQFMQRYLEQAANSAQGIQGMNAVNSATAYNNNLEAGLAVAANSRRAGSYIPTYQKAVVYTPQAMNFGNSQQQQPTNMVFGNQPNNSTLSRIGNINGLNMYDANGQLQSFNKQQITDAGKKMEGKFIGADNQLHDKSVMGGFTANNENYKQLQNLGKRNLFNQIGY